MRIWLNEMTTNSLSISRKKTSLFMDKNYIEFFESIDVDFSKSLPIVQKGTVEKISDMENVLGWTVKGDASKIDHFIIIIERLRSRIPVFVAQAFPKQRTYEYVDTFTPRMRGPIEFKIVPVYLDFTRGEEVSMGGIISSGLAAKRRRQRR